MIRVIGSHDKVPSSYMVINTTSKNRQLVLSPFLLGPVRLWKNHFSFNVENAWQYSKVYKSHLEVDGTVGKTWLQWAMSGWHKKWADRYPMGKGAIPEYSYWDGEHLGYIEARKKIYIPLYSKTLLKTNALEALKNYTKPIALFDYDGYDHKALGMTLKDVVNCETRKMGHAFVIAMLIENCLEECM